MPADPPKAWQMETRATADGIAWAVLADSQKARQMETRPNCDVSAANATKIEWDPTLVQSEEEDEVEEQ